MKLLITGNFDFLGSNLAAGAFLNGDELGLNAQAQKGSLVNYFKFSSTAGA
jgi:hypothetical protein